MYNILEVDMNKKSVFVSVLILLIISILFNILFFIKINKNNKDIFNLMEINKELKYINSGKVYRYDDKVISSDSIKNIDSNVFLKVDTLINHIDENVFYSNSKTRVYIPLDNIEFMLENKLVTDHIKENIKI